MSTLSNRLLSYLTPVYRPVARFFFGAPQAPAKQAPAKPKTAPSQPSRSNQPRTSAFSRDKKNLVVMGQGPISVALAQPAAGQDPLSKWNVLDFKIDGMPIRFVRFKDFRPNASPEPVKPNDGINRFVSGDGRITLAEGISYKIESEEALKKIIFDEARASGIDPAALQPCEAIKFAVRIVEKNMDFEYDMTAELYRSGYKDFDRAFRAGAPDMAKRIDRGDESVLDDSRENGIKTDGLPADKILGETHLGVCRHYAQMFNAVFYALKEMDPSLSNVYSTAVISKYHAWVLLLSAEEKNGKKEITATMIDLQKDDLDGIPLNDLNASSLASDEFTTSRLLERISSVETDVVTLERNAMTPKDIENASAVVAEMVEREFVKLKQTDNGTTETDLELRGRILAFAVGSGMLTKPEQMVARNALLYIYLYEENFVAADEELNALEAAFFHVDEGIKDWISANLNFEKFVGSGERDRASLNLAERQAKLCSPSAGRDGLLAKIFTEKCKLAKSFFMEDKYNEVVELLHGGAGIREIPEYRALLFQSGQSCAFDALSRKDFADAEYYLNIIEPLSTTREERFNVFFCPRQGREAYRRRFVRRQLLFHDGA